MLSSRNVFVIDPHFPIGTIMKTGTNSSTSQKTNIDECRLTREVKEHEFVRCDVVSLSS